MKPNGYDKSASRANGRSLLPLSREARGARLEPGGAASDDARDFPAAAAPCSGAAGMERDACAEMAPPAGQNARKQNDGGANTRNTATSAIASAGGKKSTAADDEPAMVDIPPGIEPLAADGPGFVDAMHAHVDLYLACARLVKSTDEKIAQRMVERLLEMSYGKSPAAAGEEVAPIIFDAPHPPRD